MTTPTCGCSSYDDLPIDIERIAERVALFKDMRPQLRQLSQKMVERWTEHYRLYKCEACDQYWQATLAPRDSDTWYFFKVPRIGIREWKDSVYVCPGDIAVFLEEQTKFLANEFHTKEERCNEHGCNELAMVGSVKCKYHQFMQIGFGEDLNRLRGQRWFSPYSTEILQPNNALQPTVESGG